MVMRGLVFHPLFCMVLISESYLACFCVVACSGNRSWQYVNSMSWIVIVGEGVIGVWVWFGAPITHRMSSLSLAWQLQGGCGHAHLRSQSGIVWSGGWLLILLALVSVKKRVFLFAWSVWVMRCTALSCLAILRPSRYGFSNNERRCGHVSLSFLWHSVQLWFWCVSGQKIFFLWLPMYWAYLSLCHFSKSDWRVFGWFGRLITICQRFDIRVLLLGLYIPDLAMLPSIWPSEFLEGGMFLVCTTLILHKTQGFQAFKLHALGPASKLNTFLRIHPHLCFTLEQYFYVTCWVVGLEAWNFKHHMWSIKLIYEKLKIELDQKVDDRVLELCYALVMQFQWLT